MPRKRNLNLDLVRVVSCFAVIGLHTFLCDVSFVNSVCYYLCGFAVEAFFMSSGYILVNRKEILFQNTVRKIGTILFVVALWNGGLFILKFSYKVILHHDSHFHGYDFFLMIGKSLLQRDTMFHFWYFGALILLYIFVYLIQKIHCNQKQKIAVWASALILSIGLQIFSYILGASLQRNLIQTFRLWTWIQYFMLGGLLAGWSEKLYEKLSVRLHVLLLCILSVIIPLYQYYMGNYVLDNAHAEFFYDDPFTIIWVMLLFTLLMRIKLSERISKLVNLIAPCTMGMYIVHPLLIKAVSHVITLNSFLINMTTFLVILCASFVITFIMLKIPVVKKLVML